MTDSMSKFMTQSLAKSLRPEKLVWLIERELKRH